MRYGTLVKLFRRAAAGAANAVRSAGREKGASPVAIAQGRPRVGFVPVGRSLPQIRSAAAILESQRVDSLWASGHLAIGREVPAAMTGLAAVTERQAVGTAVLLAPLYHPVIVAKQAAELDVLTEGRVALGLGSGKSTRWSSVPAGCLAEYALVVMTAAAALLHEGAIRHSVTATLAGADRRGLRGGVHGIRFPGEGDDRAGGAAGRPQRAPVRAGPARPRHVLHPRRVPVGAPDGKRLRPAIVPARSTNASSPRRDGPKPTSGRRYGTSSAGSCANRTEWSSGSADRRASCPCSREAGRTGHRGHAAARWPGHDAPAAGPGPAVRQGLANRRFCHAHHARPDRCQTW